MDPMQCIHCSDSNNNNNNNNNKRWSKLIAWTNIHNAYTTITQITTNPQIKNIYRKRMNEIIENSLRYGQCPMPNDNIIYCYFLIFLSLVPLPLLRNILILRLFPDSTVSHSVWFCQSTIIVHSCSVRFDLFLFHIYLSNVDFKTGACLLILVLYGGYRNQINSIRSIKYKQHTTAKSTHSVCNSDKVNLNYEFVWSNFCFNLSFIYFKWLYCWTGTRSSGNIR